MKWSKKSLKTPKNSPNSQDENQQRPTNFKRPSGNKLGLPSNTPGQSELEHSATLAAMRKGRMYCYLCSAKVIIYFIITSVPQKRIPSALAYYYFAWYPFLWNRSYL